MDYFSKYLTPVIGALLWAVCSIAQAYYVEAQPPVGWRSGSNYADGYARIRIYASSGGGSSTGGTGVSLGVGVPRLGERNPGQLLIPEVNPYRGVYAQLQGDAWERWLFKIAPGSEAQAFVPAAVYGGGVVVSTAVRVGGGAAWMRAFLRFAAHHRRDGALQGYRGAAVGLFMTMLAGAGIDWIFKTDSREWHKGEEDFDISDGNYYKMAGYGWQPYPSADQACAAYVSSQIAGGNGWVTEGPFVTGTLNGPSPLRCNFTLRKGTERLTTYAPMDGAQSATCPAGWYITSAGCTQLKPPTKVTEQEFVTATENLPWPQELPENLPDGLPVEPPVINPSPTPWDKPKPFFEPIGEPTRNPKFDPQQQPSIENPPFIQPGRLITPVPVLNSPWNTDVKPVDRPILDDEPGPRPNPNLTLTRRGRLKRTEVVHHSRKPATRRKRRCCARFSPISARVSR